MAKYTISCQDGTDPQCEKELKVDISISGLTKDQLADIIQDNSCLITSEQIKKNSMKLDDEEKKQLDEQGTIVYSCYVESICGACGSDYTRDDDGNIID